MTNLVLQRYKTIVTHFASDYGPVNLSGIQFDLKENIEQAEHELADSCPELHDLNRQLRIALDSLFELNMGTTARNTDPVVRELVGEMDDMAFKTETLHQVAGHPLPALMISYMAQLAGIVSDEPLYSTRWGEAKEKAEKYIAELEEAEHA